MRAVNQLSFPFLSEKWIEKWVNYHKKSLEKKIVEYSKSWEINEQANEVIAIKTDGLMNYWMKMMTTQTNAMQIASLEASVKVIWNEGQ